MPGACANTQCPSADLPRTMLSPGNMRSALPPQGTTSSLHPSPQDEVHKRDTFWSKRDTHHVNVCDMHPTIH